MTYLWFRWFWIILSRFVKNRLISMYINTNSILYCVCFSCTSIHPCIIIILIIVKNFVQNKETASGFKESYAVRQVRMETNVQWQNIWWRIALTELISNCSWRVLSFLGKKFNCNHRHFATIKSKGISKHLKNEVAWRAGSENRWSASHLLKTLSKRIFQRGGRK